LRLSRSASTRYASVPNATTITAQAAHQEMAWAKSAAGPTAQPIPVKALEILTQ